MSQPGFQQLGFQQPEFQQPDFQQLGFSLSPENICKNRHKWVLGFILLILFGILVIYYDPPSIYKRNYITSISWPFTGFVFLYIIYDECYKNKKQPANSTQPANK